jgi:hypothetical protein
VAMVIALALVLANPPTPSADLGPRVRGRSFDGVIVRTSDPEGWTPSEPQIEELERLLPRYVRSRVGKGLQRPLFQHKRQYVGWLDHGRKLILVTFFHDSTDIVKSGQWLRILTTVAGGGDNFMSARFDADAAKFVEFGVNGPR